MTKPKYKVCILTTVVMFLWFIGSIGFFMRVLDKVLSGHGLDYYTTFWGVQMNYVGTLVTFLIAFVIIILAPVLYWFSTAEERSFKEKFGIDE